MKRTLRIVLAVVGVLAALLVAAVIALPLLFDPNDYKPQINAAIERQIGREVTISGDIGLSVFPWLGLEIGRVTVANAQGFGDEPMAEVATAQVSVKLLPLLTRDIEVGTVSLDGLRLRLARNAEGRSNWADISQHLANADRAGVKDNQSDALESETPEAAPDNGFTLSSLQIGAIEINDAAVSWRDAGAGADYRATHVNLSTGRLVDGEPVHLEFDGDLAAPGRDFTADFNLVTRIEPNIVDQFYRFSDLNLSVIAEGEAVPNGKQQFSLSGNGEYDVTEGRAKLSGLSLQGAGLNITGNADGSDLNGEPVFSGRVTVKEFNPRAVMRELEIEAPATQDDDALSSAGFDAQFTATPDRAEFKQILATLDESSLKGSAQVQGFDNPAISFDLDLDQLDIDGYLPPGSAEQAQTEKPAETGGGDRQKQAEIDLAVLEDLRLDGKLSVGSLTAGNVNVSNAEMTVKARDGVLTIEPLRADLYDGNVRASVRVDASGDTPRYALKGNLNGLQFQPLLNDVADTDRVAALANMNIDITTAGKQVASMKRALNGSFGFDLRDGVFNGFNLAQLIASARSRLSGEPPAEAGNGLGADQQTPFSRFAASFNVNDGVMSGDNLKLVTPVINANGSGRYDLVRNALDYTINVTVAEDADGKLSELAGITVPIKLSGNLMSPDYSLDLKSALRGVAEKRLQQEKAELEQKVREEIGERSKDLDAKVRTRFERGLQSIFGGGRGESGAEASAAKDPSADEQTADPPETADEDSGHSEPATQ